MEAMNYTLGRGELYFNQFKPGTMSGIGERYFGNTPEISISIESETLDHYNSDRGVREKDDSVILETSRTMTFTTDHVSPHNLALFYLGSVDALTVTGATGEEETFEDVTPGLFYQLGVTQANPTGARLVSNVVVTDDSGNPTTFVAGTDYMLNAELGRIEILEGGNITKGTNIVVTYDVAASTREVVISGSATIEGSLRYIAQNPKGKNIDYYFPYVKISPNGDFALKGDEWQQIPFTVEILRRPGFEAIYATSRATTAP
jgi:hypothetical protein